MLFISFSLRCFLNDGLLVVRPSTSTNFSRRFGESCCHHFPDARVLFRWIFDRGKKMLVCCSHRLSAKVLNIRPTRSHRDFRQTHMIPCNSLTSLTVTSATTRTELKIPEYRSRKILRNFRKTSSLHYKNP